MNPPSTRIRKRRAPQRQQRDPHQTPSVLRRRSSRIQSRQRSVSIPHNLGSYYESQSPLEQRPTDPQTSQPVGATSYTHVPTSSPIEVSAPVPSRAQLQEDLCSPQTYNDQSRKRRSNRSVETSAERPLKRARLTKKNLKAFEKMGGQRKSAGKRTPGQSSSSATTSDEDSGPQRHQRKSKPSESETKSTRSKQTTSTTESGFQDIAFDNGILNPVNSKPPVDLDYMQDDANRTRDTESPSESEYQEYVHKIQTACNKQTVLLQTSQLLKEYDSADSGYSKVYNHPFNTFPKNVGFNDGLSAAQPDMVEGLDMPEFDPFPVRQHLGGAAVVTSGSNATTLSHLAGEWKGPGKDMAEAQTQAAYDGATLVYGRNKARMFLGSPDPAGHSFVSTFTTDGTIVNTFAHYSSEAKGQIKYHQYAITSTPLTSSFENFKKGRRQLRNTQDRAKNAAYTLRDELIEKWSENLQSPVSPSVTAKSADSTDCDSYDYDEEDPNSQLVTEYWTSFLANLHAKIPTVDNVYAQSAANFLANNQDNARKTRRKH